MLTEVPEDSIEGLELCVRRRAKTPAKGQVSPDAPIDADREVTVVCIFRPELQVRGNLQRIKSQEVQRDGGRCLRPGILAREAQ